MIHTVHTIIYRCMLHLLLIGDASQEYYRAMMHHRHNKMKALYVIDLLCI